MNINNLRINIIDSSNLVRNYVIAPEIKIIAETEYDISISTTTDGASIFYTTDGTTPDETKTAYTDIFNVAPSTTVKAIAIKSGYNSSSISEITTGS